MGLGWKLCELYLAIRGDDAKPTLDTLLSLIDDDHLQSVNNTITSVNNTRNTTSCYQCRCNELVSQVEGSQLDLVIAESQLSNRIKTNEESIAELRREVLENSKD